MRQQAFIATELRPSYQERQAFQERQALEH
jgi:hypothetical protein